MKRTEEQVLTAPRRVVRASKRLAMFLVFLAAMLGGRMELVAQNRISIVYDNYSYAPDEERARKPDFSNPVMTTDCCPKVKNKVDSIMNNAPFVFEGRMIKWDTGSTSYLFEIEKVYRGGKQLQVGTVEVIAKLKRETFRSFSYGWHIIFAKEINDTGSFDANNSIKLELYNNDVYDPSCFGVQGNYYRGFGLNFESKESMRDFLASYNLLPADIPKADIIMTDKKSKY